MFGEITMSKSRITARVRAPKTYGTLMEPTQMVLIDYLRLNTRSEIFACVTPIIMILQTARTNFLGQVEKG